MVARGQQRPGLRRRVQRPVPHRRHDRLRELHAGLRVHLQQPERHRRLRLRQQLHRLSLRILESALSEAKGACLRGMPPSRCSRRDSLSTPHAPTRRPCTRSTSPSSALYFVFTLGVGLWVVAPPAERGRLLPRRARSAGLGHPALHRRHRDLARSPSSRSPGIGARGDLTFLQLTFGYLVGRIGVARLAPPRLLPGRPGDRLRPAGIALRRRHPPAHLAHLPRLPLPGRRGPGLRQRHPARAGHRLERPDRHRGHGRRHHGLHLVRRVQGGGLDRRAAALGLPRGRHRRAVHRLAAGRRRRTWRSRARARRASSG